MENITDKICAILPLDNPSPVGFINVYELGDIWIKTKGCDVCSKERRLKCCGNCPMITSEGDCSWQVGSNKKNSSKPFYCAVQPSPNMAMSGCALEFKCIAGNLKGKIRRVTDIGDKFR